MRARWFKTNPERRLRVLLLLFFLALAIPTALLILHARQQLQWESFHHHRELAEELVGRIDRRVRQLIAAEDARPFSAYAFLAASGTEQSNLISLSPLSQFPVRSELPGVIGYFQVDPDGRFSSPLLPVDEINPGLPAEDFSQRMGLHLHIREVLAKNSLVRREAVNVSEEKIAAARVDHVGSEYGLSSRADDKDIMARPEEAESPVTFAESQAAFDRLNSPAAPAPQLKAEGKAALGRVEELMLDESLDARSQVRERPQQRIEEPSRRLEMRKTRKEQSAIAEAEVSAGKVAESFAKVRVHTFEGEIDPLDFSLLDSGHLVLFRNVWRDGQRYVQGLLIDQAAFLQGIAESAFREATVSSMSDLAIAYQGDVLTTIEGGSDRGYLSRSDALTLTGSLLYRSRLSAPLGAMELLFAVKQLPDGPGSNVIAWIAGVLGIVLVGGFFMLYRLGLSQINLVRQQQDFVSAVSHELKTPLTSIRMYGEMLKSGWVDEARKKTYYDYIYQESERLSRLINNVLQLARLTRNRQQIEPVEITVAELMSQTQSKVLSQIQQAGFSLELDEGSDARRASLRVDPDCFAQIVINLVDNAIKFSASASKKVIKIACRVQSDRQLRFSVRDFGPGVAPDQMKKIFELFYRPESELTRETAGTGIGLALVHQLALAMNGRVDVCNREPGAEFSVMFPLT
jgi:signal transduction histidine kinase